MHYSSFVVASLLGLCALGCGSSAEEPVPEANSPYACDASAPPTRTASCVESFEPGDNAGFGADRFPDVVYGKPLGSGDSAGGIDVLSLGRNGTITVGFGGNAIVDGPGVDFTVFENPFYVGGNPDNVFHELAEVAISADGETWVTLPCMAQATPPKGCAGYAPVYANADVNDVPFDPAQSGGDPFDLEGTGLSEVRFVRIRDVEGKGGAPTAGFDLDAVAIVNPKVP